MPLPRAKDVPWTANVSGLVFVLAMFSLGSPMSLLAIFVAWGLVYVTESLVRRRFGRPATEVRRADADLARRHSDVALGARDDERT